MAVSRSKNVSARKAAANRDLVRRRWTASLQAVHREKSHAAEILIPPSPE